MPGSLDDSCYRTLDPPGVLALIAGLDEIASRLGGAPKRWHISEVGDGNLNLVFIVDGPGGSVCVKQAVPYVRVAGPSWPMALDRAFFENAYYRAVAPHVGGLIPAIYHYDDELYCTIMERLSPHIILRQGLIAGRRYPHLARDVGEYVARACFFTSDLAVPFEQKLDGVALFAGNKALLRISVDLIFYDPYMESDRNRHTSPQLDRVVAELRRDASLKAAVARLAQKFLTESQSLLHGDLHSGSVMVTESDTRVIDPEFAFYGPIGFDAGAFIANLLLSWYSQPGHAAADADRTDQQAWLLGQIKVFWESFRSRFRALGTGSTRGDVFPNALFCADSEPPGRGAVLDLFLDSVLADTLGFAACKMIRRIVGFAHVLDFEAIEDPARRALCERGGLGLARQILTEPGRFRSIEDLMEAVPRFSSLRGISDHGAGASS